MLKGLKIVVFILAIQFGSSGVLIEHAAAESSPPRSGSRSLALYRLENRVDNLYDELAEYSVVIAESEDPEAAEVALSTFLRGVCNEIYALMKEFKSLKKPEIGELNYQTQVNQYLSIETKLKEMSDYCDGERLSDRVW